MVTVVGDKFVKSPLAKCKFGHSQSVRLVFQTSSLVVCHAQIAKAGNITVGVTMNNLEYVYSNTSLTVVAKPDTVHVSRVSPSNAPTKGGTLVTVYADIPDKAHSVQCVFDTD
jgi:hypothetical protein